MRAINPNLKHLHKSRKKYRGAILKGSSRSGKTFSSLHFIIKLCAEAKSPITINIVKETYNSFKTTLYDDFNRILPNFGLYSPFLDKKEVDSFKILGSKINLLGADKPSKFHGASCDYLYFNEMLDISNDVFDQSEMRCRVFWWGDFNPKLTQHWVMNRPDVSNLVTTWKDNPYISNAEKNKILSYEPTKENIEAGMLVRITLKKDQRSGQLTEGVVDKILTKSSNHHHGIKVRLEDGRVGRVKEICEDD